MSGCHNFLRIDITKMPMSWIFILRTILSNSLGAWSWVGHTAVTSISSHCCQGQSAIILTASHQCHTSSPLPYILRTTRSKPIFDTTSNSRYKKCMLLFHLLQMTHSQRSTTSHPDLFHWLFHQEKYQATEIKTKEKKTSALDPREVKGEKMLDKTPSPFKISGCQLVTKLALRRKGLRPAPDFTGFSFISHFWPLTPWWLQGTSIGTGYPHLFLFLTCFITSFIRVFTLKSRIVKREVRKYVPKSLLYENTVLRKDENQISFEGLQCS